MILGALFGGGRRRREAAEAEAVRREFANVFITDVGNACEGFTNIFASVLSGFRPSGLGGEHQPSGVPDFTQAGFDHIHPHHKRHGIPWQGGC